MYVYNTTFRVRTARKWHRCGTCRTGNPTIAPGHRYIINVKFPGATGNETGKLVTERECLRCMTDRIGYSDTEWHAQPCSTFCCGDVPCVRKADHVRYGGDNPQHSCHRCTEAPAELREANSR